MRSLGEAAESMMLNSVKNLTGSLFSEDQPQPVKNKGLIHTGTSGFSFADWKDSFYPPGLSRDRWLQYYARHFTVVEINATYYRIPSASVFAGMVERTPDEFGFWVKLPRQATHERVGLQDILLQFLNAVQPLTESGKLLGYLAQFPVSFRPTEENFSWIAGLRESIPDVPLAVEFRHEDWLRENTFDFLTDHNLVFVVVDEPSIKGLLPAVLKVTGSIGYIRFHGRNARTWYNTAAGDRYDYDYSQTELKEWVPRVISMDEMAPLTYLFFNNCHAGQAVKNARMMQQLLENELKIPL